MGTAPTVVIGGTGVGREFQRCPHRPDHHDRPERAELLHEYRPLVRRRAWRQPAGSGQGRVQRRPSPTEDQVAAAIQALFHSKKKVTEEDIIGLLAKSILGDGNAGPWSQESAVSFRMTEFPP